MKTKPYTAEDFKAENEKQFGSDFDAVYPDAMRRIFATVSALAAAQQEVERLREALAPALDAFEQQHVEGDCRVCARLPEGDPCPALVAMFGAHRAALASSPPLAAPEAARSLSAEDVEKVRAGFRAAWHAEEDGPLPDAVAEALNLLDRAGKP